MKSRIGVMGVMGVMGLMVLGLSGCMNMIVPKTVISGSIGGQPFTVTSPKDSSLAGLDISAATNGEVKIHIESLTAKMNPDVITMTGESQVKIINAVGTQVREGLLAAPK